jgi:hypothetical protein
MMRFMLLYHGPAPPNNASHEGWRSGSPTLETSSLNADRRWLMGSCCAAIGSTSDSTAHLNGYSVIQADDLDQVLSLMRLHPYLRLGDEYSIEIHSVS